MKPSERILKNSRNHPLSDNENAVIFEILNYLDEQAEQHAYNKAAYKIWEKLEKLDKKVVKTALLKCYGEIMGESK